MGEYCAHLIVLVLIVFISTGAVALEIGEHLCGIGCGQPPTGSMSLIEDTDRAALYRQPTEELTFLGVSVLSIIYEYKASKLATVYIRAAGPQASSIYSAVERQFGEPPHAPYKRMVILSKWETQCGQLTYKVDRNKKPTRVDVRIDCINPRDSDLRTKDGKR